ncbi:MAG: peptidylprolyl isomerase [Christensenellales bacterium]|jgi:foldase protein PrsA
MKRTAMVALTIIFMVAMLLSGCSLFDNDLVAVKVGDKEIKRSTILASYEQLKSYYGLADATSSDDESVKEQHEMLKNAALETRLFNEVIYAKAQEAGAFDLSDEERTEVDEENRQQLESYKEAQLDYYKNYEFSDLDDAEAKAQEALDKDIKELFASYEAKSEEEFIVNVRREYVAEKYLESLADAIEENPEKARATFDEHMQAQKEAFADTSIFEEAMMYGDEIYYYPPGFRYVKHILINFEEDDLELVKEKSLAYSDLSSLSAPTIKDQEDLRKAEKEYNDARDEAAAKIKDKAEELLLKVDAGEDFDELIDEYGEDPGMSKDSAMYNEKGYLLNEDTGFVKEFKAAALELEEAGDTTELVMSDYGYHIIKLVEVLDEGEVDYAEHEEEFIAMTLEDERVQYIQELVANWVQEFKDAGKIVVNYKVLGMEQPQEGSGDTDEDTEDKGEEE